jgi:hypothetical protein
MPTMDEVVAQLSGDEIDYQSLALTLGPDALPELLALAEAGDPAIAPKAVFLASLMQASDDVAPADVVRAGMQSGEGVVRVAAAASLANLSGIPTDLFGLLADADVGVRKAALDSVAANLDVGARDAVLALAAADPEPVLRALATDIASRLG